MKVHLKKKSLGTRDQHQANGLKFMPVFSYRRSLLLYLKRSHIMTAKIRYRPVDGFIKLHIIHKITIVAMVVCKFYLEAGDSRMSPVAFNSCYQP